MQKEQLEKDSVISEIRDETENLAYLKKYKFKKTLSKLVKKLQGKTVLLYGAGVFLETIKKHYDLSGLNIIGISDVKYEGYSKEDEFLGYKTYAPILIRELNPDYVVVSTKYYMKIVENLNDNILNGTDIKIKPLVRKGFWALLKEVM